MRGVIFRALAGLAALAAVLIGAGAAGAGTLEAIKARGSLLCGISRGLGGFSEQNSGGIWVGIDADLCRALAAAVLADPEKVTFVPLSTTERFDALKSGAIDVLARDTTWTFEREAKLGLLFAGVNYYDGQGFLVARRPNVTSALELDGVSVCVQDGTTTRENLADFFKANSMTYKEVLIDEIFQAISKLDTGGCDVFTTDQSALYVVRLELMKPNEAIVLPDVISKEPLGPAVRGDDVAWFNIVKWTLSALIDAEELGVGKSNLDDALKSSKPSVRRLLGVEGDYGKSLGLDKDWAFRAIRAVGNYGESFDLHLGAHSRFGIPRGINALWNNGGILYAPPMH
jgi:general L-amino acid transport system substrate-binding protein